MQRQLLLRLWLGHHAARRALDGLQLRFNPARLEGPWRHADGVVGFAPRAGAVDHVLRSAVHRRTFHHHPLRGDAARSLPCRAELLHARSLPHGDWLVQGHPWVLGIPGTHQLPLMMQHTTTTTTTTTG